MIILPLLLYTLYILGSSPPIVLNDTKVFERVWFRLKCMNWVKIDIFAVKGLEAEKNASLIHHSLFT